MGIRITLCSSQKTDRRLLAERRYVCGDIKYSTISLRSVLSQTPRWLPIFGVSKQRGHDISLVGIRKAGSIHENTSVLKQKQPEHMWNRFVNASLPPIITPKPRKSAQDARNRDRKP